MVVSGYVPQAQTILYNFGSPRIFNYPVQQAVQAAIPVYFRVTHYKDIFVHLPPCQSSIFGTCETGKYGPASENQENFILNALDDTYNVVRDGVLTAALGANDQESLGWNPFWAPWHIQNQFSTTLKIQAHGFHVLEPKIHYVQTDLTLLLAILVIIWFTLTSSWVNAILLKKHSEKVKNKNSYDPSRSLFFDKSYAIFLYMHSINIFINLK